MIEICHKDKLRGMQEREGDTNAEKLLKYIMDSGVGPTLIQNTTWEYISWYN